MVISSVDTYLPYLLRNVSAKVNTVLSTRLIDPFNVYFDYGLYTAVTRSIYNRENGNIEDANIFPLIWLVSNSVSIVRGKKFDIYGDATFDLIIAMPTSNEYTSQQRTDNIFMPRLYPIYDELLNQISLSSVFQMPAVGTIQHRIIERSYWGGSETGSADTKNLFNNFIDAIQIVGMRLNINQKCFN